MKQTKKKIGIAIMSVAIVILLAFSIILNVLALTTFDNIFEQALGKFDDRTEGDTKGADVQYYKSDYENAIDLRAHEEEVVAEMAMEGATLLKNNDGVLPLKEGTTLSLFSHSSVDIVSGGSGSGSGSFELTLNLKEGLERSGFKVNQKLWDFYSTGKGSGKEYTRGAGSINYGADLDWNINEVPLSVITSDSDLVKSFEGTTAMFVMSRTGGEGADLARDMAAFGGESGQHYLEPDKTELEIIKYLCDNFDDVILLVNANNVMELTAFEGEEYENLDAIINFPGAGRTGTIGLGYMLRGIDGDGNEISPSGHLVDTWVSDNFSSPAMQNMGDFWYDDGNPDFKNNRGNYYYVNYAEGIYVGYKYYETRYEDTVLGQGKTTINDFDYSEEVLYPFGYGLSYTTFEWSEFNVGPIADDGTFEVSVKVTNTGDRAGKEVVQIYAQTPYTEGGVEKASIALVGFDKTELLYPAAEATADKPASETVTITLDLEDFISYNENKNGGKGGYVLDAGDYYITASTDAHSALNNVLDQKGETELAHPGAVEATAPNGDLITKLTFSEADAQKYAALYVNGEDGEEIVNLFDYADVTVYDSTAPDYLSRSDWSKMNGDALRYGEASTYASEAEINGKKWVHSISDELMALLKSEDPTPSEELFTREDPETPVFDARNGVELIDLRGLPYDDPLWEDLLDNMTVKELSLLVDQCGYCSPAMASIHKPKVTDLDGPAGLNLVVGHGSVPIGEDENGNEIKSMTWPSEYLLASTWNVDLAYEMGLGVAEDGLHGQVEGWYGPAVNIHRTPFAGRNFEYYSEDAFLSGEFGYQAVKGAAEKGMYAFLKHFALNDQETHRDHLGIVTWSNEQAIREIYLKPFQMVIEDNYVDINVNVPVYGENGEITGYEEEYDIATVPAATAIMSSFNRIGPTWAGGNYNLLTEVLREEWGFNGFVLTDYEVSSYMGTTQCLAAGGDGKLKTVGLEGDMLFGYDLNDEEPVIRAYAREAAHHILYTVVNSAGMNGFVHGIVFVPGFAFYKFILIAWDILAAAGIGVMVFFIIKNIKALKRGTVESVDKGE